ncbi:O-glucosyltransferase rumi-like protein, partial [Nymphaea thermarum]
KRKVVPLGVRWFILGIIKRETAGEVHGEQGKADALPFFTSRLSHVLFRVESVSRTATVAGHNLDPTPWHSFTPLTHSGNKYSVASTILKCSYLTTCPPSPNLSSVQRSANHSSSSSYCPSFFQWIHEDLAPWRRSRISLHKLLEAQRFAAFRVVIVGGRLYVDFYYACVQSRAMFTVWSFLQLIKRYRGRVPDVDLMFDCMDRPTVRRSEYKSPRWPPPPLFRYCSTKDHFDIPFPDWSFWGWPEVNLESWDKEFSSIKKVSQTLNWESKQALAYWKGNPDVQSPVRTELMKCNDSTIWSTKILRQDWAKEASAGYEQSKLANQCNHKYKIYAEGYAWSVSLKYILSCGSLPLIITPRYYDFFSRGLMPRENYFPVRATKLCRSIKHAVDWSNKHPFEAEAIGRGAQGFMQELDMETVYSYMFHLLVEYSKLQDFKPSALPSTKLLCEESVLCFADPVQRRSLERSSVPVPTFNFSGPCMRPLPDHDLVKRWMQQKTDITNDIKRMEVAFEKRREPLWPVDSGLVAEKAN